MDTTTGSNLPCFSFDLCCSDRAVIDGAKFHADTIVVGDEYHITKRTLFAARSLVNRLHPTMGPNSPMHVRSRVT